MILLIQLILGTVLVLILILLWRDESRAKRAKIPIGKLTSVWEGAERRRHVRVDVDIPVRYILTKDSSPLTAVQTKNISMGGLCITIAEKLKRGDVISVEIDICAVSERITAKGEIMWVKEETENNDPQGIRRFDIGLEFKELSNRHRKQLFNFLKEQITPQNG